jgi:hypothetical protein
VSEPRRLGRRPKDQKRLPLSMRITPALRARLVSAAAENGRSITQEAELRLEQTVDQERSLVGVLELGFGRQVAAVMLAIGYVIKGMQPDRRPGDIGWLSDPEVFREIVDSINLLLQAIDPHPHPAAWAVLRRSMNHEDQGDAALYASIVAQTIADSRFADDLAPLMPIIRSWIGEAAVARLRDRLGLLEEDAASGLQEDQAAEAVNVILEAFRPQGEPELPHRRDPMTAALAAAESAHYDAVVRWLRERLAGGLGIGVAGNYLAAIVDPESGIGPDLKHIGADIAAKLGEIVIDQIRRKISDGTRDAPTDG